jgi:hypothetical protein
MRRRKQVQRVMERAAKAVGKIVNTICNIHKDSE